MDERDLAVFAGDDESPTSPEEGAILRQMTKLREQQASARVSADRILGFLSNRRRR